MTLIRRKIIRLDRHVEEDPDFVPRKIDKPGDEKAPFKKSSLSGVMSRATLALGSTARAVNQMKAASVPAEAIQPRVREEMPIEEKIIAFIETLKVPDGPDVGRLITLRDWQKDMIRGVYGPRITSEKGEIIRAIRQAVWTMGRKNGKTSLAAGLVLCHLTGPTAIWNGQLFSVAFDVGQASLAFRALGSIVLQDPELTRRVVLTESSKRAMCMKSNSVFRALSSESRSKHGLNPNFVLFDEFAQFGTNRELFDVMTTSMGAQKEPLALIISTQAAEDVAVLSQLIDYGESIQKGDSVDPTFHLTKYAVPQDADVFDESKWLLANPALGDFRSLDELRQYASRARSLPAMMNSFRNLYLNQRVASVANFVDEITWARCAGEFDMDSLEGRSCTAGLDLSSKVDLTSLVLVFDDPHVVVPFFWTPQNNIQERSRRDKVPYEKWADLGYIETVPGVAIDFRFVVQRLAQLSAIYNIRMLGFDRWRVDVFKTWMDEYGVDVPMAAIGQGFKDGSLMVDALETELLNVSIMHDNHPVLKWNALNTKVVADPAGNRKFDKSSRTARIDGFVAMAMAIRAGEVAEAPVDMSSSIFTV